MTVLDGYPNARCIRVARRVRLEMVQSVPADYRASAREITPRVDSARVIGYGNDVVNIVQLDQVVVPCRKTRVPSAFHMIVPSLSCFQLISFSTKMDPSSD
jgi:hypothetical protein